MALRKMGWQKVSTRAGEQSPVSIRGGLCSAGVGRRWSGSECVRDGPPSDDFAAQYAGAAECSHEVRAQSTKVSCCPLTDLTICRVSTHTVLQVQCVKMALTCMKGLALLQKVSHKVQQGPRCGTVVMEGKCQGHAVRLLPPCRQGTGKASECWRRARIEASSSTTPSSALTAQVR